MKARPTVAAAAMRRRVVAVAVAGVVVAVAAESGSYLPEEPGLAAVQPTSAATAAPERSLLG
jgi:hypothetical protein